MAQPTEYRYQDFGTLDDADAFGDDLLADDWDLPEWDPDADEDPYDERWNKPSE